MTKKTSTCIVILLLILSICRICDTFIVKTISTSSTLLSAITKVEVDNAINIRNANSIRFQGGGIKFWWQAGVIKAMQEYKLENKNLHSVWTKKNLIGVSAGSLSATFLALDCDMDKAAEFAIYQANRENLFNRRLGLLGIWRSLVEEWLDYVIDDDKFNNYNQNDNKNKDQLYLGLTDFSIRATLKNGRYPTYISSFETKSSLINACCTSCHLPFFMDGKLYSKYEGKRYIDGSFWSFVRKEYVDPESWPEPLYNLDWRQDLIFSENFGQSFVSLISPDGLYEMMECGYNHMKNELKKE